MKWTNLFEFGKMQFYFTYIFPSDAHSSKVDLPKEFEIIYTHEDQFIRSTNYILTNYSSDVINRNIIDLPGFL